MPWSPAAHAFFALCAHNPGKARKKCPKPEDARRMAAEGVKAREGKAPRQAIHGR